MALNCAGCSPVSSKGSNVNEYNSCQDHQKTCEQSLLLLGDRHTRAGIGQTRMESASVGFVASSEGAVYRRISLNGAPDVELCC